MLGFGLGVFGLDALEELPRTKALASCPIHLLIPPERTKTLDILDECLLILAAGLDWWGLSLALLSWEGKVDAAGGATEDGHGKLIEAETHQ